MDPLRFVVLDPRHFHAALVLKSMYAQVSDVVHIYAPLGPDLAAYVHRISDFNNRLARPTSWQLEVHARPDFAARLAADKPGNVVILAGRNAQKIDSILLAIEAGMNVLADKPWILTPADMPKLVRALNLAHEKGLVVFDIMTERFEITSILQRALVSDEHVFGTIQAGSPYEPGVYMESVHYLKKKVAGVPLRRPLAFFDIAEQGEGLSDVGTHLVDLVPWILFPDQAIDFKKDLCLVSARREPVTVALADFKEMTGESEFPPFMASTVRGDKFPYLCNTFVDYTIRGIHVKLDVLWGMEAEAGGGDTHRAVFQGSASRIEVRQGREESYLPELYVYQRSAIGHARLHLALENLTQRLQPTFPGVGVVDLGTHFRLSIPSVFRVGHEPHFAQVTELFLRYLRKEETMPAWETPNMLAKYMVTTGGVEMARRDY